MKRAMLMIIAASAVPVLALAQTGRPDTGAQGPTPNLPNLANPQAQANMGQQAPQARTSPGAADAPSVPTPELSRKETPTPQR